MLYPKLPEGKSITIGGRHKARKAFNGPGMIYDIHVRFAFLSRSLFHFTPLNHSSFNVSISYRNPKQDHHFPSERVVRIGLQKPHFYLRSTIDEINIELWS